MPNTYWRRIINKRLLDNRDSILYETGWYNSLIATKPINANGVETAWLNYSFLSFIDTRLNDQLTMFEYGSGSSTHYFAKKIQHIISVEHNKEWYEKTLSNIPENVDLIFENFDVDGRYAKKIEGYDIKFDLVLIDGRDRLNCIKYSVSQLSDRGVIILDNSMRERYATIFSWEGLADFRHITFTGIVPGGFKLESTTVFYRSNNCLGI